MRHRLPVLPTTPLGVAAGWLALGYVLLTPLWRFLPGGAAAAFVCGAVGGVVALVAIFRRHERAVVLYLALLPLAFVVLFVALELAGHA